MTEDIQKQKPFTVSQVHNEKPNAPRTISVLSGYLANSFNAGHNRTIFYKKVMAGERHNEFRLKMNIKLLTPKTPTYQNLRMTIRAYFVPNSRIWTNAEKYTAQKGGATEIKIDEIPNLFNKKLPTITNSDAQATAQVYSSILNGTKWRDSFISSYIPRFGSLSQDMEEEVEIRTMPAVSALPLRGRVAIYNDMERNKEFDEEVIEYKDDTVSQTEWESYLPTMNNPNGKEWPFMRSKLDNSYYSDFRTELQGIEEEIPNLNDITSNLSDWLSWENLVSESRSEASNAQLNDWQIIAKLRGSKMLTEGKVQLIGKKTFNLNYAAITQNTYNNGEEVDETFRVLGQQGAYSYTEVNLPIYAGMEFIEEGYVHFIATVSADTVYESGFDRNELNIHPMDEYRPDLIEQKDDVLYALETGYGNSTSVIGFKRKFSEYFKLNNIIAGDMVTQNYYQQDKNGEFIYENGATVITQKTFQFFEKERERFYTDGRSYPKKGWKDYSDLMLNKNQAIMNPIQIIDQTEREIELEGQNQIFFVGTATCLAELPINEEIKKNYTTWGEH